MEDNIRSRQHKKHQGTERILAELEELLSPAQTKVNAAELDVDHPMIFIMGCARSGSTALLQYLSDSKAFCYPSNIMSRFHYAPYIGARIHQLLIDNDSKNEMAFHRSSDEFRSSLGKTSGADAPHEYWYFWRKYFKFGDIQQLKGKEFDNIDEAGFTKDLKSIQYAFDKPLIMKAMIMNWNIELLHQLLPRAIFLHIKRDTAYNAQSLLNARQNFFGDATKWYSFKPPEYHELKNMTVEEQVVHQVHVTNQAIEQGLAAVPSNQTITVKYEDFCTRPKQSLSKLSTIKGLEEIQLSDKSLSNNNKIKLPNEQWNLIKRACQTLV